MTSIAHAWIYGCVDSLYMRSGRILGVYAWFWLLGSYYTTSNDNISLHTYVHVSIHAADVLMAMHCIWCNYSIVCLTKPVMGETLHWSFEWLLACSIVQRRISTIITSSIVWSEYCHCIMGVAQSCKTQLFLQKILFEPILRLLQSILTKIPLYSMCANNNNNELGDRKVRCQLVRLDINRYARNNGQHLRI